MLIIGILVLIFKTQGWVKFCEKHYRKMRPMTVSIITGQFPSLSSESLSLGTNLGMIGP
ncbi:hypothetical protein VINE108521_00200 [Vibrio neonatus]